MTWTLVSSTSALGSSAVSVSTTAINTTGANLITVGIADYAGTNATPGTMTDSAGNSWPAYAVYHNGGSAARAVIFYIYSPTTSASHTFTYTCATSAYAAIGVIAWTGSGGTGTAVLDKTSTGDAQGVVTLALGSITPVQNNELIIAVLSLGQAVTAVSINNGTIQISRPYGGGGTPEALYMTYYQQGTAAAVNMTYSWTTAAYGAGAVASFELPGVSSSCTGRLPLLGVGCGVSMVGWTSALLRSPLPILGGAALRLGKAARKNATISRRSLLTGHNGGPKL